VFLQWFCEIKIFLSMLPRLSQLLRYTSAMK